MDKINNYKLPELVTDALEEKLAEQEILSQSLASLRSGLAEKKKEAEEYYNQLLRLKAEFENYRKRVEKEKEKMYLYGKESILLKLISVLDTLEQAEKSLKIVNEQANEKKITGEIISGLKLIILDFHNFLKNEGLEVIESVGKIFDPHYHEVIEQEENTEKEEGIILAELQKGYVFKNSVIRPAKVRIAKTQITAEENETRMSADEEES